MHEGLGSSLGGGAPPVRRGDLLRLRVECRGLLGEEVIVVVVAVPAGQSGLTERGMAIALTTPAPRLGDIGLQLLQLGLQRKEFGEELLRLVLERGDVAALLSYLSEEGLVAVGGG